MLTVVGMLVVGVGVLMWRSSSPPQVALQESRSSEPPALPLPDKPSIAVLPFTNMSNDPEQEYFSDGMTDDIITDLSKISGLFVIARNSTFTYKGHAVDIGEVSRKLGVRHVLEGSVRKIDNRVRINVQLIDAPTGGHVWAERYDRELEDIFALQDEITHKIVFALQVALSSEEQQRVVQKGTANLAAYDYYLRGREQFRQTTAVANAQARQMYEKAIGLDPEYAEPYAAWAWTHLTDWTWQWTHAPQSLEQAFELAQKAVALDDALPLAHAVLGQVLLWKDREHEQAIAEVERAIVLDPNNSDSYIALADMLSFTQRRAEALGLVEKAMRLNPRYPAPYLFTLGYAHCVLGQSEESIAAQKRALTRNPDLLWPHVCRAACAMHLGREEEAQAELAEIRRLNPQFSWEVYMQHTPFEGALPEAEKRMREGMRKLGFK